MTHRRLTARGRTRKRNEPSRCNQHRNGSRFQHEFTMPNASSSVAAARKIVKTPDRWGRYFWDNVNKDGPCVRPELGNCWMWTAGKANKYGSFKRHYAHRLSFAVSHGRTPDGMFVCHHCDTPLCVNPLHLFLGTNADNHADMMRKGRHGCTPHRGVSHGCAKLVDEQVLAIRSEHRGKYGESRRLAKKFGVSESLIHYIVKRVVWRHI